MPRQKTSRDSVLEALTDLFRTHGFEGTSLNLMSEATGLQKASLYHLFPGGKQEMAEAVLGRTAEWFTRHIFEPLAGPGTPQSRLATMILQLDRFYVQGEKPCLLNALGLGPGEDLFHDYLAGALAAWKQALITVGTDAGQSLRVAEMRAEDALVRIQGALVLSRATGDPSAFQHVLESLPDQMLTPA